MIIIYEFMDPLDGTRNPALKRYALFLAKAKYKSENFEEKNETRESALRENLCILQLTCPSIPVNVHSCPRILSFRTDFIDKVKNAITPIAKSDTDKLQMK